MTKNAPGDNKSNRGKIAKQNASSAKAPSTGAEQHSSHRNSGDDGGQPPTAASRSMAALVKTFEEFLFELDSDGKFLGMWSSRRAPKSERQLDFIGRHAMEVLGEEVFLPFSELFQRVIETRQSDGIEFPVELEDGRHWFYARVLPVARRFGKPPSVSLLTHDITAQKKTEDELRKSEALLAQAEQLVNMGSWEIGASLQTGRCSDNLYRILGFDYRGSDIDLRKFMRHVRPEDAVTVRRDVVAAIMEGKPYEHDLRYISPKGELRNLHSRGFPLRNAEGRVDRIVGVAEDVTDRVNAKERLRFLSDRLLTLRDEEQRRMAQQLHETVSQEMAAMKMALARVGETLPKKNKTGNKFLQSAREFADAVIQQVRTVSYLLHPLLLEEAGLGSALRWYASGFAERSGIKVKVAVASDFGRLPKETEIALFRIVQEALTNVHRHSKSRSATIRLVRADGKVRMEVKDSGVGMAPPSAATGWNPPLGIGIAGMRDRVKQLGGIFEIRSKPKRGTAVCVELPVTESSQLAGDNPGESTTRRKGSSRAAEVVTEAL
ncbi:MAG: PAS domain-containing protein [Candidatus Acidiferrales bacterium]